MSNYRRARVTGASYFFTVTLANRGGRLLLDHIDDLRGAFAATMQERPFICDAVVVLPDHIHAVWTLPQGDADFSTRWGAIKARFTRQVKSNRRVGLYPTDDQKIGQVVGWNPTLRSLSKIRKGDAGIWQRRFWEHMIRDELDYRNHMEYCWSNPVKHGFVERAVDWPFSSLHRELARGVVSSEWAHPTPNYMLSETPFE